MVYSVAAATARRRVAVMATRQATQQGQKRSFGAPPPEWEGIDKVVRGVFPGDHQRKFTTCMISSFRLLEISQRRLRAEMP
jgi:hypothetical protein